MFAWLFVEWYTWRIGESSYMYFYLWRNILKVYRPDRVYSTGKKDERGSAIICHKSDVDTNLCLDLWSYVLRKWIEMHYNVVDICRSLVDVASLIKTQLCYYVIVKFNYVFEGWCVIATDFRRVKRKPSST